MSRDTVVSGTDVFTQVLPVRNLLNVQPGKTAVTKKKDDAPTKYNLVGIPQLRGQGPLWMLPRSDKKEEMIAFKPGDHHKKLVAAQQSNSSITVHAVLKDRIWHASKVE